jgi:hypothetical protein
MAVIRLSRRLKSVSVLYIERRAFAYLLVTVLMLGRRLAVSSLRRVATTTISWLRRARASEQDQQKGVGDCLRVLLRRVPLRGWLLPVLLALTRIAVWWRATRVLAVVRHNLKIQRRSEE